MKDFDIYEFYADSDGVTIPHRTRWRYDFGPSKFGREEDAPEYEGLRVNLFVRALPVDLDADPVEALGGRVPLRPRGDDSSSHWRAPTRQLLRGVPRAGPTRGPSPLGPGEGDPLLMRSFEPNDSASLGALRRRGRPPRRPGSTRADRAGHS